MHTQSNAHAHPFVVDPENRPLVSGEISFTQRSQQKVRNAVICCVLALLVGLGLWLFYESFDRVRLMTYFIIALFTSPLLITAISNLYSARLHRQLAEGQFLEGRIISSKLAWKSRGKGSGLRLEVIYHFQTPDGNSLQRSVKAWRRDL